jgi:alpha-1,6-mannosyltransferase
MSAPKEPLPDQQSARTGHLAPASSTCRPLKVLDITEFYSPWGGGVRAYLAAKAEWLAGRSDVEHTIVVPGPHDGERVLGRSRVLVVGGPAVPKSPGYHLLAGRRRVHRIFAEVGPHVVEVGSPFLAARWALSAARAMSRRPALVGFYHSDARRVYVEYGLRRLPAPVRRLAGEGLDRYLARLYSRFDLVVAASRTSERALLGLGIERVERIPLGVNLETFHPRRRDPAWRREVKAPDGAPLVLYAGRLATEKNLAVVMRALPLLRRRWHAHLVLMGEGHLRPEIERLAARHPEQLSLLPFEADRARVARALASADVFVAPGPWETFGLAALEALASGLPVAGAAAGGIGELLEGVPWARTFDPNDPGALCDAVGWLLEHCPAPVVHAHHWVAAGYDQDRMFQRLVERYRAMAAHP